MLVPTELIEFFPELNVSLVLCPSIENRSRLVSHRTNVRWKEFLTICGQFSPQGPQNRVSEKIF